MDDRSKGWYWLVLVLVTAMTVLYVQRRDLPRRYLDYEQGMAELAEAQRQCAELESKIETSRQHAENLGSDPVEIEAAIRRSKHLVREGETVFRIEEAPQVQERNTQ